MTALILGLIAAACWGLHDFCLRFISQKTPISACLFTVMLTGLIFQTGLLITADTPLTLPKETLWPIVAAGLSFSVANFGLYQAFQRGPVWLAAPLVACFSVFSVGIAVLGGASVSVSQWLAILVTLTGIAIIALLADEPQDTALRKGPTVFYALLAAVAFSVTFTCGQYAAELTNELISSLGTRVFALSAVILFLVTLKLPFWPGKSALAVLLIMGILDSLAILSITSAGAYPNPQYAAVATALYGLPTIWLASVFLKEPINARQWIGCFIAFCGIGYLAL
jgi:drug/metabolite transporter (DMT)-like permease